MDSQIVRPKTRGELRDKLMAGEKCEVAGDVADITAIMLGGWLNFNNFTVKDSETPGWVIFEPMN